MRTPPLAIATVLAWATPVRADAVPPPPDDCPRGSVGRTGHAGTYCEESSCASDADCEAGRVCRSVALCVREVQATFWTYTERPARETFRIAIRECGTGPSACPPDAPARIGWASGGRDVTDATSDESYRVVGPARCTTAMRCVPASEPAQPPESTSTAPAPRSAPSSSCAAARRADPARAGFVLALAALFSARRRSHARAPR
ncbi:MAG TPA: hypothetical protein VIL20_14285 [Sandaracinaceae bacterium]